jgi:hypothetical protein
MANAWDDPAMAIQVGINTGGVKGEIREAFSHSFKSGTGCQGGHHPQAVTFNPAELELLEGMDESLSGGDLGGKNQDAAASINLPWQPIETESQVGNLGGGEHRLGPLPQAQP